MRKLFAAVMFVMSTWVAVPALAEQSVGPVVNINHASAAEIAEVLQGVGESKAQAIVAYRDENGAFESVESLAGVKGIGQATVERNRERISLQ
ncbi:ComEA family DNA-binding protein [Halopseudomonas phragmitis]|uniref:Helix-hairpin-helix DNA-binding motif class 1 domain-containing protein n=2 Tax=Pseudomonadaceae TaxID=135621 RepID=A0A1V0B7L2_9GAMM|nr:MULTISPECIES: ComEA family DNA-binding protein [Pseudomonadaceae]AQZ95918.1 hypothetical protein BVH74_14670 [Halopseudomonas phragmitis]PAU88860.1 hypothetical protein CK507_04060 [Pseudomonas sp. WN033]RHW21104.1 ComEA family DNA-binding protein [Pseudomonas jilinensis]